MKERIKTPEKQLSHEEIVKLSDAEFKTLAIRMLTERVESGHKTEEKVKPMKSEIKENVQGTKSEGKETGTQINDLEQKEEINIQLEQKEETKMQKKKKMRRVVGTSGTTLNAPTSKPEGCQKEKTKKWKTYWKIVRENFPNVAKEIDFQEVQEA